MSNERLLCRARRKDNGKYISGYYQKRFGEQGNEEHYIFSAKSHTVWEYVQIDPSTLCQGIILPDRTLWEGDIYQWKNPAYGTCTGVIRFGRYEQDASGGEYPGIPCYGFFVDVLKIEPEFGLDDSDFPDYMRQISVLEMLERNTEVKLVGRWMND